MPYKPATQKFSSRLLAVTVGTGDKQVTFGGGNTLPLYTFDGDAGNSPKLGIELSDLGADLSIPGIAAYYSGCDTLAAQIERAGQLPGADFVVIKLDGADPNGQNRSVEDTVALVAEAAVATDMPLVIEGCKNAEKDAQLFEKLAGALEGRNLLFLSAKEENYKTVGAAVGLAYGQKVGAESSVDINLAKQLNVLTTQLGVQPGSIVMNVGAATVGYGYEYVASTMERVKMAALSQNDNMLQMPIITPVASEAWSVKESLALEEDMPAWGNAERRGISMEVSTASACLAAGSDALILRHPQSVATISALIQALFTKEAE